jgi:hypothetical protein
MLLVVPSCRAMLRVRRGRTAACVTVVVKGAINAVLLAIDVEHLPQTLVLRINANSTTRHRHGNARQATVIIMRSPFPAVPNLALVVAPAHDSGTVPPVHPAESAASLKTAMFKGPTSLPDTVPKAARAAAGLGGLAIDVTARCSAVAFLEQLCQLTRPCTPTVTVFVTAGLAVRHVHGRRLSVMQALPSQEARLSHQKRLWRHRHTVSNRRRFHIRRQ